ncbi:ABC transporter permease [bacterium]|jgi:peptide/nickel transport system permease protein|nr:ABC transporter permease [bacterium]
MDTDTVEKIGYWTIVWEQFRKNKLAMFGLSCIFVMVLVAVFSPFISLDKPIFYATSQGWGFPLFRSLFDRNFFENGVDLFFNIQIFLVPVLFLVLSIQYLRSGRGVLVSYAGIVYTYLILSVVIFLVLNLHPYKEPYKDWVGESVKASQAKESSTFLFSLKPFSYRQTSSIGSHPQAPGGRHLLGTDKEGRDVFARMVYGTRISLTIGIVAVSIYIFIGIILGSIAGFFGGTMDMLISRFIEIMLCFPTFFLILTLSALIHEKSIFHVMLIIGFTRWPEVARLVRAEFLKLKNMDYVQAAIALGLSKTRIIFGHVLPNALGPVIVTAVFGVASSILIESSLSFLGLGDVSAPSWGEILSQGRQEYKLWLILCPGLAIFFMVSIFNLVGEGLQDAMDPKLRR